MKRQIISGGKIEMIFKSTKQSSKTEKISEILNRLKKQMEMTGGKKRVCEPEDRSKLSNLQMQKERKDFW